MKKYILFLSVIFAGLAALAQEEIKVTLQERPSSSGLQPAFEVEIPQATTSDAIHILERKLAPRGIFGMFRKNPKLVPEKDEWIMREIEITEISNKPLNVYVQVSSFPERLFVKIFFQEENDFIGFSESSSAQTADASGFVRDYAVEVYRHAVEKELKHEEGVLRSLENELRKMGRQQSSNEEKIKNMRSDNNDMRNEIREFEMRLGRKQTFQAEGEVAQIVLEQHETDAKQLQKDIRKNQKNIRSNERRISKFESKGKRNLKEQADILNSIDRQKIVVGEIRNKLSNIR
jgi:hypothetical protein